MRGYCQSYKDYSSKYGFGYRLSSGKLGALFNDASSLCGHVKGMIEYQNPDGDKIKGRFLDLAHESRDLQKKMKLFEYFDRKLYFDGEITSSRGVKVRKYGRSNNAMALLFNDDRVQIEFFDNIRVFVKGRRCEAIDMSTDRRCTFDINEGTSVISRSHQREICKFMSFFQKQSCYE